MDLNAKNPMDWKFGDILAYDPRGDGNPDPTMRVMFVFPDYWAGSFTSINLSGFSIARPTLIPDRSAALWMRIEKAP